MSVLLKYLVAFFFFFFAAIQRLQDMGASYFILDLRDNRGGLVQVSVIEETYVMHLLVFVFKNIKFHVFSLAHITALSAI